ncbi:MAG: caspase family protein [Sphingobacteriales bacterium]|nr:caspase family protein [Sphingobacteriales bacterium]
MRKLILFLLCFVWLGTHAQTGDVVVPTGSDINKVLVDKQGKYLYTIGKEKIIMWDKKTHVQLYTFYNTPTDAGMVLEDPVHLTDDGKVLAGLHYPDNYRSTVTGEVLTNFNKNPGIVMPNNTSTFLLKKNGKLYFYESYEGIREIDSVSYANSSPRSPSEDKIIIPGKALAGDFMREMKIVNNGQLLVYNDKVIQLWDLEKMSLIYETKFSVPVREARFLKKKTWLLTFYAMGDKFIYELYDLNTGKYLRRLPVNAPPQTYQTSFCVSEENNTIAILEGFILDDVTGATGKTAKIKLYDLSNGLLKKTFPLPDNLEPHYYSEKENSILLGNQVLYNLDMLTGKIVAEYTDQLAELTDAAKTFRGIAVEDRKSSYNLTYFADNKQLLTLDTRRMIPAAPIKLPANFVADHLAATLSGDTILYSVYGAGYFVKSLAANKVLFKLKGNVETFDNDLKRATFFSDDGSYLYFFTKDYQKDIYIYNRLHLKTGVQEPLFSGETPNNSFVSADKQYITFLNGGIRAGQIRLFNLQTRQTVAEIPFINAPDLKELENLQVKYLALSKESKHLLTIYSSKYDTKIRVYDIDTKKVLSESKGIVPGDGDRFFCNDDLSMIMQAGASGGLIGYDRAGNRPFGVGVETRVTDVAFSDDGKTVYTTTKEQTIKAWDLKSNKLYGTLYVFKGCDDYVFIAPTGHFDGNEGGIKRLYYLKDRNIIPLDKIYEKAYTPNLYERLVAGELFSKLDIQLKAIPVAKITYAAIQRNLDVTDDIAIYQNTSGQAEITVNASSVDDSIDEIRLFHNGKIVNLATRGLFVTDDSKQSTSAKKYTVNLLPGKNSFRAIALNSQRTESQPDEIIVSYQNGNPPDPSRPVIAGNVPVDLIDKNATLHLVVVGINKYRNEKMSLNYALADATSFKDEVEKSAKTMLTNIKTYFVTDTTADKNGITDAFAEVQKNAKPRDVFVFYYAGHGVISEKNKEFYLVPTDVTDLKNVDEALAEKGIASKLLQGYAIDIQAQKQLFILDACQSAGAFESLLQNDGKQQKSIAMLARSTGTHWMAASGAQQFANEFAQLGHGAFTYVLLQALKGEAASNKMITVNGLKNFMQVQVPVLMKKYNGTAQYPASYGIGNDFPVEILK